MDSAWQAQPAIQENMLKLLLTYFASGSGRASGWQAMKSRGVAQARVQSLGQTAQDRRERLLLRDSWAHRGLTAVAAAQPRVQIRERLLLRNSWTQVAVIISVKKAVLPTCVFLAGRNGAHSVPTQCPPSAHSVPDDSATLESPKILQHESYTKRNATN